VSWTTPTPSPIRSDPPIYRLLAGALVTLVGLFSVGLLLAGSPGATSGAGPSASVARVAGRVDAPAGRRVFLAPLGDFPAETARALVDHYRQKYGLEVTVLDPATIDPRAMDAGRDQLVAEDLIESMRSSYPAVATDTNAVLIGLVSDDLYIRDRPDWEWAFGLRLEDRFGVVSTARMRGAFAFSDRIEMVRLRKMVTRDIGLMYYGLPISDNPRSVLFRDLDGVGDLDSLSEDF
jgi:predicted Zn-dependent protease